jgi:hypothetical protein
MSKTAITFRSAWLKVERANRHIDELQTAIATLSSPNFYGVDVYSHDNWASSVAVLAPRQPIPDSLPLIIGDSIHNLKCAFDHIFVEAYRGRPPIKPLSARDISFPFYKYREHLITSARIDAIEHAIPGAKRAILDEIEPYGGGKHSIYALHSLDLIDKHNELIVVTEGTVIGKLDLVIDDGTRFSFRECRFNARDPVTLYSGSGKISVECDFKAAFDVRFAKVLPFGNEPVLPTLVQLSDATRKAIELLASLTL